VLASGSDIIDNTSGLEQRFIAEIGTVPPDRDEATAPQPVPLQV
jgi:hypothetical protein